MRRLRDMTGVDEPVMIELAEMVRAVGDLEPGPGAEDRVLQAMARRAPFRPTWWLRAVAMLLIIIAVPLAAAGVYKLRHAQRSLATPAEERLVATAPDVERRGPMASVAAIPEGPPMEVPSTRSAQGGPLVASAPWVSVTSGPSVPGPKQARVQHGVRTPASRDDHVPDRRDAAQGAHGEMSSPGDGTGVSTEDPSGPPLQESPGPLVPASLDLAAIRSDEAALVINAMRALRRDHDARAAIQLLATYRRRFPSGDLIEEVLALSIEAFTAADDREAIAWAAEYLRRFPEGRFHDLAERTQRTFEAVEGTATQPGSSRSSERRAPPAP